MRTDVTTHPRQDSGLSRSIATLVRRWPAALGIAIAALTAFDLSIDSETVDFLAALVIFMALVYLGAAVLGRRSAAWVVFLAGFAVVVTVPALDVGVALWAILLVAALAFLVLGLLRHDWSGPGDFPLQAAGMLGFGAVALSALIVAPDVGGYVLAAGLLGHAVWDAVHFRLNRTVARSYAEACAVLDLLVGAALLVTLLSTG